MMTKAARIRYHRDEWPVACEKQGWSPNDTARRHNVILDAMFLVRGPDVTTSHEKFGDAETTALFTYLRHLADPDNITLKLRWDQCMADYVTFNKARQADYWQRQAYGSRGNRWARRFGNKRTAQGDAAEDAPDAKETRERLTTMRARAQGKPRRKMSANPF